MTCFNMFEQAVFHRFQCNRGLDHFNFLLDNHHYVTWQNPFQNPFVQSTSMASHTHEQFG